MSEVTNVDLFNVLLAIKDDLGALKANVVTLSNASASTAGDVKELQMGAAKQKGIMAGLAAVGTLAGAGVGYAIDLFARH